MTYKMWVVLTTRPYYEAPKIDRTGQRKMAVLGMGLLPDK